MFFLRAKYLDRAKDVLVINLLKAILSAPFGTEHKRYEKKVKTLALSLRENSKREISNLRLGYT